MKKYQLVALGGTFDHFHKGHERFLTYALSLSHTVIVGITNDKLALKKTLPQAIQPLVLRKAAVVSFLEKKQLKKRSRLVLLNDIYGPTLQPDSIQALVATRITYPGAVQVNQKRRQLGLKTLPIYICPMVKSNDGRYLSSTRIRQGRVARSGQVYRHLLPSTHVLPDDTREQLRQPLGQLLTTGIAKKIRQLCRQSQPFTIALVGDVVTQFFQTQHLPFDWAAVDLKIGRQPIRKPPSYVFVATARNRPGTIAKGAVRAIWRLEKTQKPGFLKIIGEEDLLVIPFVLSLPLTSYVFYGQPNQGVVAVEVTESAKAYFSSILDSSMTSTSPSD
jgi:pantetheine-phosphate adenylyltransferase